jgi:hypothetical protein
MLRVGDRVRIKRDGCAYWSHDSRWVLDGETGRVDGTWRGHPGGDDAHHVSVAIWDRGLEVASMIFAEHELTVVRRGQGKVVSHQPAPPTARAEGGGVVSVDIVDVLPDLVCGQTYRSMASEMVAMRMRKQCGHRTDGGCHKPMTWIKAYRCRECARWMHGECLDAHFVESRHDNQPAPPTARAEGGE